MKRSGRCKHCNKTIKKCKCYNDKDNYPDWKGFPILHRSPIQKCKDDPYYFFTEYCTINGERPAISEERFNEIWETYNNSSNSVLLIKSRIK